jgi:hypothetical protein
MPSTLSTPDPLRRFILRVFVWLPVCFGLWYFSSVLFAVPLEYLLHAWLPTLVPTLIEAIQQQGNHLFVITKVMSSPSPAMQAPAGQIVFELNPLQYGYAIPLYSALVLAAPGSDARRLMRWLIGLAVLTFTQLFGLTAETLKILAIQLGDDPITRLAFDSLDRELIALAYQFGFLILPSVVPILIWGVQFREFLQAQQASLEI